LPWGGDLWRISGSFASSAGSRLALHHWELNLTSENAPIYHPQRWDEEKLARKRSFSQRSRKGVSYSPGAFFAAIDSAARTVLDPD